jgi:ribA/ribD-fused uncharacterized protein
VNRQEREERDNLTEKPVTFYHPNETPYGFMSNFSLHPVKMVNPWTGRMEEYATTEHRFQAMKAATEDDHFAVLMTASPGEAKNVGREVLLRDGWGENYGSLCWYVMVESLFAKVEQHPKFLSPLQATGYRAIWEDSPTDDIWGIRYEQDYRGKNLLGRSWMYVRNTYRSKHKHPVK